MGRESAAPGTSADPREVAKFADLAASWWDQAGPMGPLHRLNPVRVAYVRDRAGTHFGLPGGAGAPRPLAGIAALDVGCGGGIVTEPLARLGATVTGIDPSPEVVEVARRHAAEAGVDGIAYEAATLEAVADAGRRFDLVLALEVVEHAADVPAFLAAVAAATRPGGLVVLSTLSRTVASYLGAIVGAEYLFGWLPRGTHSWRAFLTPAELARHLRRVGLRPVDVTGMTYRPDRGEFRPSRDTGVNYLMAAARD